jgi:hypothetical protein
MVWRREESPAAIVRKIPQLSYSWRSHYTYWALPAQGQYFGLIGYENVKSFEACG